METNNLSRAQRNDAIIELFSEGATFSKEHLIEIAAAIYPVSFAKSKAEQMHPLRLNLHLVEFQRKVNRRIRSKGRVLKSRGYGETWYVVSIPAAYKEVARYTHMANTATENAAELAYGCKTGQLVLELKTK